jgi:insertion element IS1 protein InsB
LNHSASADATQMIGAHMDAIWIPCRGTSADKHEVGKRNTQKIERKNLNFRTWIKRLVRKTICFSKLELMHDTVIGLLINKVEFGLNIYT